MGHPHCGADHGIRLRTPVNLQSQLENQSFKPSTPTTEPRALPTSRHPPNHLAYASLGSEQQASASKTVSSTTHDAQRAQGALAIDSGKIQDDEKLAVGMQGLGVKSLLPHQIRDCSQPQAVGAAQATSELWSFKKRILASKGIEAELLKPKSPSSDYLLIASRPSTVLDLAETLDKRPKLLVLDLNQTLLVRKHSTSKASKNATPRPYLSAFWEYICGYDELQPGVFQRRFSVMVS